MKPNEQSSTTGNEWCATKNVLSEGDLTGTVTLLGPGAETPSEQTAVDRVLYVAQGSVTASTEIANTIINTDQTFHVPEGRALVVRNHGEVPARFFTLTLPMKRREAPILTFPQ
jgi:mannose-6-phosphate isomerase-like protein (cupin superfamily)